MVNLLQTTKAEKQYDEGVSYALESMGMDEC